MSDRSVMLIALAALSFLLDPRPAAAQAAPATPARWEFVIASGRFVPLGAQRTAVAAAGQSTATLTRLVTPSLAVTASLGWARSRDLVSPDRSRLDVLTYDLGAELRTAPRPMRPGFTLRTIAGAGLGVRSYDPRGGARDATHGAAAFVAVGAEAGIRRLRARVELRDHVAGASVLRGFSGTRNDLAVNIGLRLEKR